MGDSSTDEDNFGPKEENKSDEVWKRWGETTGSSERPVNHSERAKDLRMGTKKHNRHRGGT